MKRETTHTLTVTFDNGQTREIRGLSREDIHILEGICGELHLRNAVELSLNGDMWTSYPEHHSGEHKHVRDAADGPLWTATRSDVMGPRVWPDGNKSGEAMRWPRPDTW